MARTLTHTDPAARVTLPALLAAATDSLHARGLEAVEIVAARASRGTVTARVTRRGSRSAFIAKWIAPDAPPRARGAFENEARFYSGWQTGVPAPEPIEVDTDVIVLADAGGRTLAAMLLDAGRRPDAERAADIRHELRVAFDAVAGWIATGLETSGTTDRAALERRLAALRVILASGGSDVGSPIAAVGAALERATRPGFAATVGPAITSEPRLAAIGRAHGALDGANVLLSRDRGGLLLDFGAWSDSGSVILDAVHALATSLVATSSRPGLWALVRNTAEAALERQPMVAPIAGSIVSLAVTLEPIGRQNPGLNRGANPRLVMRERLALLRSAVPRNRGR